MRGGPSGSASASAADFIQTDIVLVGVLIIAALGYGLDQIFRALERHIVHWAGRD